LIYQKGLEQFLRWPYVKELTFPSAEALDCIDAGCILATLINALTRVIHPDCLEDGIIKLFTTSLTDCRRLFLCVSRLLEKMTERALSQDEAFTIDYDPQKALLRCLSSCLMKGRAEELAIESGQVIVVVQNYYRMIDRQRDLLRCNVKDLLFGSTLESYLCLLALCRAREPTPSPIFSKKV